MCSANKEQVLVMSPKVVSSLRTLSERNRRSGERSEETKVTQSWKSESDSTGDARSDPKAEQWGRVVKRQRSEE